MIPVEAVEVAAKVMLGKMYDDKTLMVDDEDRDIMRAALEAAAPHMLAGAWEEGVAYALPGTKLGLKTFGEMRLANPHRTDEIND